MIRLPAMVGLVHPSECKSEESESAEDCMNDKGDRGILTNLNDSRQNEEDWRRGDDQVDPHGDMPNCPAASVD